MNRTLESYDVRSIARSLQFGDPIEVVYTTAKYNQRRKGVFRSARVSKVYFEAPLSGRAYHIPLDRIVSIRIVDPLDMLTERERKTPP